jgi:3-oxoacyl-[acyl-carrier protein] reductase
MADDIAIVTGASGGIGRAVARMIHERSGGEVRLALQYHRNREAAAVLQSSIPGSLLIEADLSSAAGRDSLVRAVLEGGTPYILVNNAGTDRPHEPALSIEESSFDALVGLNLKAPLFLMKAFGAEMARAGSGVIVNVSSVLARKALVGSAVYRATKAALEALTLQFASELGPRGVRVNAVAPGFIETAMTDGMADGAKETALRQIPLGSFGRPEAVAEAVCQLIDNDYMNGAIVAVDGGLAG